MSDTGEVNIKRDRLVITASSLGTVFEWYDFFVYGTLAALIGKLFFPAGSDSAAFLKALAVFGVGFGVRPLGALLFGVLGDKLGRKYTFLVTITLMGVATAGIGFLPTYATIGVWAPILLVVLRALQGLALGGEYGGAAIYVAEHAPRNKRGFYTGFIQGSVVGGFILSLAVVLTTNAIVGKESDWAWRIPFLFSLLLLAVSLWIRMKLSESPVFQAMKEAGETAVNPLKESFDSWAKVRRLLAAVRPRRHPCSLLLPKRWPRAMA
jgi:MFS family permease